MARLFAALGSDSNERAGDSKFYDVVHDIATLGVVGGQLLANSERYLQAVRSRSRLAKRYGEDLARQVLDLAFVKLAQEVVDGGPMAYSGATRLAEAVLAAVAGREIADE